MCFSLECLPGAPLPSALLRKEEAITKEVCFFFELLAGSGAGGLVPPSPPGGLSGGGLPVRSPRLLRSRIAPRPCSLRVRGRLEGRVALAGLTV